MGVIRIENRAALLADIIHGFLQYEPADVNK
jgi:hypothetical protein